MWCCCCPCLLSLVTTCCFHDSRLHLLSCSSSGLAVSAYFLELAGIELPQRNPHHQGGAPGQGRVRAGSDHGEDEGRRSLSPISVGDDGQDDDEEGIDEQEQEQDKENIGDEGETIVEVSISTGPGLLCSLSCMVMLISLSRIFF